MEEYILRLVRLGYSAESAWNICYEYFFRRDYDGLEVFVANVEARKCS